MFSRNALTEEQLNIVNFPLDRDLYIEAPAGHGKTTTAMLKAGEIAKSLVNNTQQKALVLTYSKMAVRQIDFEMHQQVPKTLHSKIAIKTYHAFYYDLICHYARYIGFTHANFSLLTHEERKSLYLLFSVSNPGLEFLPFSYSQYLAAGIIPPVPVESGQSDELVNASASFLGSYHFNEHRLGFEDFPFYAYSILAESSFVSGHMAYKYPYVFLDEFQNTNDLQWAILKCFSPGVRLVVFSDPNQTIHVFRGAGHIIEPFKQERAPAIIPLTTNFRNSSLLYNFAKGIATGKFDAPPPREVSFHRLVIYRRDCWNIKFDILRMFKHLNNSIKSIALLTKTNQDVSALSNLLSQKTPKTPEIHHEVIYDDYSIQNKENVVLAIYQLLATNNIRFLVTIASTLNACSESDANYMYYLNQATTSGRCSPEAIINSVNVPGSNNPRIVLQSIKSVQERLDPDDGFDGIWQLTEAVLVGLRRIRTLPDFNEAFEQLRGVWNSLIIHNYSPSLDDYIRYIMAQRRRLNFLEQRSYLRGLFVMTLHQSQGKQFDAVFIWRCNDGIIPHPDEIRSGDTSPSQYLMYVGITRARHLVHIYYEQNDQYQPSRLIQPFIG